MGRLPPTRDKKRLLLHVPIGVICAFLTFFEPLTGLLATAGFFLYEINEDWRIRDEAYVDVLGWLYGFVGTAIAFVITRMVVKGLIFLTGGTS